MAAVGEVMWEAGVVDLPPVLPQPHLAHLGTGTQYKIVVPLREFATSVHTGTLLAQPEKSSLK